MSGRRQRRPATGCSGFVLVFWLAVGGTAVRGVEPPDPPDPPDLPDPPDVAPVDSLEMRELLAALEESGLVLTEGERRSLGLLTDDPPDEPMDGQAEATAGRPDLAGVRRARLELAAGGDEEGGVDVISRADLAGDRWRGSLRLRSRADGPRQIAGGVAWRTRVGVLAAGTPAPRHGLGLFCSRAGSRSSLAADAPLAAAGSSLGVGTSTTDARRLTGLALRGGGPGLTATAVVGRRVEGTAPGRGGILLGGLSLGTGSRTLSCLWGRQEETTGGSLAVAAAGGAASVTLELAAHREATGRPLRTAWAGRLGLRGRSWTLELVGAGASASPPPLGMRPSCQPGPEGSGWALRLGRRLASGIRGRILISHGRERKLRGGVPRTGERRRVDLALAARPAPGWRLELRWRHDLHQESGWVDRQPWLPPAAIGGERRQQLAATLWREADGWRLGGVVKELRLWGDGPDDPRPAGAARALLGLSASRRTRGGWRLRCGWTWAWGHPVDLVSVTVPGAGILWPRHWGAWREEIWLGIERRCGALRVHLATSRRLPEPGPDRHAAHDWRLGVVLGR